MSQKSYTGS